MPMLLMMKKIFMAILLVNVNALSSIPCLDTIDSKGIQLVKAYFSNAQRYGHGPTWLKSRSRRQGQNKTKTDSEFM